jgi:hypothetical protein
MSGFVSMPVPAVTALKPTVSITIAVDTAAIAAVGEGPITSGVYLMDNMVRNGSTNEGQINLHTKCNVGALIGYQVLPIDAAGSASDSVVLTAFAMKGGDDVFTGAGHPIQIPDPPTGLNVGSYWIGQAMTAGTEIYEIQIEVTIGALQPTKLYVSWSAEITAS